MSPADAASDPGKTRMGVSERAWPVVRAGIVLGIGLGGFFDGIVFHQVLQVHHMLSSYPDPTVAHDLQLNVLADGLFHVATYLFTVLGVVLFWIAQRTPGAAASGRAMLGSVLAGWGTFNVVEGLVDHQLLGIHHVWPAGPGPLLLWDAAYLAWGALFLGAGYTLVRGGDAAAPGHDDRDRNPG